MTQTPLQTLISHIQEAIEANGKLPGSPEKDYAHLLFTSVLIAAQNLEGVEKEFGESIWTAAEKYTREDDRSIHGHEFENLSKVEFFNKLYPEK